MKIVDQYHTGETFEGNVYQVAEVGRIWFNRRLADKGRGNLIDSYALNHDVKQEIVNGVRQGEKAGTTRVEVLGLRIEF